MALRPSRGKLILNLLCEQRKLINLQMGPGDWSWNAQLPGDEVTLHVPPMRNEY